ncbi:FtsW/RodA/SpoVE family cell cycle protein [Listeria sp. PSOL-1]|uniref:FtsW/RodA/SpoVE family cell cycle protein n=1 Tax=Listeria sp. PSOL-1 TaxID=1844999 RepID=UPI0013D0C240|nr:FtsW/RodA/SpoVE family cell cycle protein [Listeria sp. PSOL-1]
MMQKSLVAMIILFSLISCSAIWLAQQTNQYDTDFLKIQIIFLMMGSVICLLISRVSIEFWRKHIIWIYVLMLILLVGIIIPNPLVPDINGAKRWYRILGFSLQPSEIIKSFFILVLAHFAANKHVNLKRQQFILTVLIIPVLLLLFKQPDLGTTIVYFVTAFAIVLLAMKSVKWILGICSLLAVSFSVFMYLVIYHVEWLEKIGLHKYQFARIYTWLDPASDPNGAYQVNLSLQAIGSGQLTGYGGKQLYIPESHTDMIFSAIANHFGFIGVSILLLIFILFIQRLIMVSLQMKNMFSSYVFAGFAVLYAFNIFENIAMSVELMPLTGIPLPFLSYGGSSVLGNFIALGIMLAVIRDDKMQGLC